MTDTFVAKQDSNVTGLRYAEETTIGVLPAAASQVWYPLEPNSYSDFGAQTKTVARTPINPSRQKKKGTLTDLDPAGGFNNDFTQDGLTRMLQGFFVANLRESFDSQAYNGAANPVASTTASTHTIAFTNAISGIVANMILLNSGYANSANNGLFIVSSVATPDVVLTAGLADETPTSAARTQVVGVQGTSGDLTITNSGSALPVLGSTTLDFTTLPWIPGQWLWIGGDGAGLEFATAANNGWARIRSITAHAVTFDKTSSEMVTDTGTGKTVQIFWGKVLQNEATPLLQVRRTYTMERTLGNPDLNQPTEPQAEYVSGAVPNEMTWNITTAEKITLDMTFMGTDYSTIPVGTTILSQVSGASAPAIPFEDAYNTTSHVVRAKMSVLSNTDASPTSMFAEITEFKFTIKNNDKANKAIGKLGPFEITFGFFEGSGSVQAYFNQVAAIQAVRTNADVSIDFALANNNAGVVFDLPLLTTSTKGLDVKINEPIMLPINFEMGADRNFNTTMLMEWFSYLPNAAMPA